MATEYYEGPVCYCDDGWHYTVVQDENGWDVPGEKLHLEDTEDGSQFRYRLATEADTQSWHERKHKTFVTIERDDGGESIKVTPEQFEQIKEMLGQ